MFNPEVIKYSSIDSDREKIALNAMEDFVNKNENDGIEIGKGRTAYVNLLEEDKTICMKAIFKKDLPLNNSENEMDFLDELSKKGYPVPKPLFSIRTEGNDYLFMETIATSENPNGMSLADLVEKNLINELPSNFDFKVFFKELNSIVDSLNNNEKIYHRDLHSGQIMINSEGMPSIIDFGDAERVMGGEDPYRRTNAKGETEIIHSDKDKVMEAYREVGQYLKSHNWFKK